MSARIMWPKALFLTKCPLKCSWDVVPDRNFTGGFVAAWKNVDFPNFTGHLSTATQRQNHKNSGICATIAEHALACSSTRMMFSNRIMFERNNAKIRTCIRFILSAQHVCTNRYLGKNVAFAAKSSDGPHSSLNTLIFMRYRRLEIIPFLHLGVKAEI